MHQRALVLKAWKQAGIGNKPYAQPVVKYLLAHEDACWPDAVSFVRAKAPFNKRDLALPIWKTGDKSLRTNLIRYLDPSISGERNLIVEFVKTCAGDTDEPELLAALEKDDRQLASLVAARSRVSQQLTELAQTTQRLAG